MHAMHLAARQAAWKCSPRVASPSRLYQIPSHFNLSGRAAVARAGRARIDPAVPGHQLRPSPPCLGATHAAGFLSRLCRSSAYKARAFIGGHRNLTALVRQAKSRQRVDHRLVQASAQLPIGLRSASTQAGQRAVDGPSKLRAIGLPALLLLIPGGALLLALLALAAAPAAIASDIGTQAALRLLTSKTSGEAGFT